MPELTRTTTVSVEQVLNGLQVGLPGPNSDYSACGHPLRDGACVSIYAYRPADATEWETPRVYCRACHGSESEIETPTLGPTEALATAFIGVAQYAAIQTTRFVLLNVELQDWSPPEQGAAP